MKTIIIGIDGGEWKIIWELVERGKLPAFKKIIENGVHGKLLSTKPPISPPAWASIITGTNPGKHGIFDFIKFTGDYIPHPVTGEDLKTPPLWEILHREGVRAGFINVPFSYPPSPINGFMVTGMLTPGNAKEFTYPPDLGKEIGDFQKNWKTGAYFIRKGHRYFIQDIFHKLKTKIKFLFSHFEEVDFLMAVFDGSDRLQHFLWKFVDPEHPEYKDDENMRKAVFDYYCEVDRVLQKILEKDVHLVVLSDHGFRPLHTDFYIEQYLVDHGLIKVRSPISRFIKLGWNKGMRFLNKTIKTRIKAEYRGTLREDIVWKDTLVYFTSLAGQALRVNLEGREKEGKVKREEYQETKNRIRVLLKDVKDGEILAIENVFFREEIYSGEAVENAPDIIVECKPGYTLKDGYSSTYFKKASQYGTERSGEHAPVGIFLAAGNAFKKSTVQLSLTDILPLVLYLHGMKIPSHVDGKVPAEVIEESHLRSHPVEYTEPLKRSAKTHTLTKDEEESIKEHLKGLGYL